MSLRKRKDALTGAVITVLFLAALFLPSPLDALDRSLYDLGVRLASPSASPDPTADVVVVAIDDDAIDRLGRWPWPRTVLAEGIERLADAGARVITLSTFLSEPQLDPGLAKLAELDDAFAASGLQGPAAAKFRAELNQARAELDTDARLAEAIARAGTVVLPMFFRPDVTWGRDAEPLPQAVEAWRIPDANLAGADGQPLDLDATPALLASQAQPPLPAFAAGARAIGHLVNPNDPDGILRTEPLVVGYDRGFYPSVALVTAALARQLEPTALALTAGRAVHLDNLTLPTDDLARLRPFFYRGPGGGSDSAFRTFSFHEIVRGEFAPEAIRGKVVIVGATATGVAENVFTPLGETRGAVYVLADAVASLLGPDYFVLAPAGPLVALAAVLLLGLYLSFVLPHLSAVTGALASLVLLAALVGAEVGLTAVAGTFYPLACAATLLVAGHLLLTTTRFLATERGKERADAASASSHLALGLSYQSDGKLDMAFDAFRRCPVDADLLENFYSLALDYERKRQFAKAQNVYQTIAGHDEGFRDVQERLARAKNLESTVLIGGSGRGPGPSLLTADGMTKPTLGKYEIESELGKGAMGIVYLGRDPKLNRTVAIKTMALNDEFDEDELADVKERFFREAETAGNLRHPNIVTVYDVGEESDLAYIAMEFLEGRDLTQHTKPDALLAPTTVLGIVFKACHALDEAHRNNVVHRDIKPANIMFEPGKKQVKLTDFGIARLTDASKTKTGMVLGTPSYMSPEQLAGRKVDGRSDLFSLGVTLFQLLTGRLPFRGDSMATLMFAIANDAHPSLAEVAPDLAAKRPCLAAIIDKALAKDVDLRYQTGLEMAQDIQRCARGA